MLSIIIPTLNEEKYLPLLLASIKKQSFSDYEIIVSDGGSTDKTKEIAIASNCKFIEDKIHHHPSWQRNVGATQAVGDILIFFDADTVLQGGFLEKIVAEFITNKLSGAGFYIKFNPDKFGFKIYAGCYNFFCFVRQYFAPASIGAGIMVKKDIHEKLQGFDTEIYVAEDYDYCFRISRLGKFRMLKSTKLLYSSRRLEKEGGLTVGLKWGFMALYTLFNFRIKKKIIKYDFGKY